MTWERFGVLLATVMGCALFYIGLKLFMPELFQWLHERKPLIWFPAFLFIVVAAARYSKPLGWLFAAATITVGLYSFYPAVVEFFENEVNSSPSATRYAGGVGTVTVNRVIKVKHGIRDQEFQFRRGDELGPVVIFPCTQLAIWGDRHLLVDIIGGSEQFPADHKSQTDGLKFRAVGDGRITFISQKTC